MNRMIIMWCDFGRGKSRIARFCKMWGVISVLREIIPYPLSMRTTDPVVLSSRPLRHSRVSADARLISSNSTHSPCLSAVTSVPYHQVHKGLTSTRKHLLYFRKNSHRNNYSKRKVCFYIALYTSPPAVIDLNKWTGCFA